MNRKSHGYWIPGGGNFGNNIAKKTPEYNKQKKAFEKRKILKQLCGKISMDRVGGLPKCYIWTDRTDFKMMVISNECLSTYVFKDSTNTERNIF